MGKKHKKQVNILDKHGKAINNFVQEMFSQGITVQFYRAITTNSFYIKLDYGLLNSVRFSDHDGKKHLKYRYNVRLTDKRSNQPLNVDKEGNYSLGIHNLYLVKKLALERRDYLINTYGQIWYHYARNQRRVESENKGYGFDKTCKTLDPRLYV